MRSYLLFNNKIYTLRTVYPSERSLQIESFAVVVMDGGNNLIGQLDIDQLGTGVRRELITSVRDLHEESKEDHDSHCSIARKTPSMIEDNFVTQFFVSTRRTALGEGRKVVASRESHPSFCGRRQHVGEAPACGKHFGCI